MDCPTAVCDGHTTGLVPRPADQSAPRGLLMSRHRRVVVVVAALASTFGQSACSADHTTVAPAVSAAVSPPAACSPSCPAGTHTSTSFLDGRLAVTYPVPWRVGEDQSVEYSGAPEAPSGAHRLLFWIDIIPVNPRGRTVSGVPATSTGFIRWLSSRPNIAVSAAHPSTVGAAGVPARFVDVAISPSAANEDPGCPTTACVQFLTWPNAAPNIYGIAGPNVVRLYLADVRVDGAAHLLAAAIEAGDADDLNTFAPVATQVIRSATGPFTKA